MPIFPGFPDIAIFTVEIFHFQNPHSRRPNQDNIQVAFISTGETDISEQRPISIQRLNDQLDSSLLAFFAETVRFNLLIQSLSNLVRDENEQPCNKKNKNKSYDKCK